MAPRSKERSGSAPLSDREKVLIGLLALTWVSIPLLLMHAGLDSHPARHENLLSTRRALVEPAAAPVLSPPPPPTPSPPLQVVDTSTTTLYHLFSVPVLASLEDIPEEDLDEVARIVLEEYHEIEKKIKVPGLEGHNEQINNDFFSWQNDVDGGWVRARWNCRDQQSREHGKSWDDMETIAFCDAEADRVSPRWPELYKSKAFASVSGAIWRALDTYLAAAGFGKDAIERGNTEYDSNGREYLWSWASVHVGGVLHFAHDHPRSLVSGTIYINLPAGSAGNIYFRDPRRAFEQSEEKSELNMFQGIEIKVAPAQGLCLIFPPWITHGVEPTMGDTPRVAISFNLRGNWTHTIMGSAAATVVAGRTGAPGMRVGTAKGFTRIDPAGPTIIGPFVAKPGSTPADRGNI